MAEDPDVVAQELARVVLSISDELWRAFAETDSIRLAGLPRDVIRVIVQTPGLTLVDIAEQLGKFPSNVSTAIRDLAERGLVERIRDDKDRRLTRLYPSAATLHSVRTVYASWSQLLQGTFQALTADEVTQIHAAVPVLAKIHNRLTSG